MDISPSSNSNSTPRPAFIIRPPPPFPAPPRSVDLSALEFILGVIAVISIPALIYTFFFAIKCPPDPLRRRHSQTSSDNPPETPEPPPPPPPEKSGLKYNKETHGKELGGECPVCLSAFAEGEEVQKLTACAHAFHGACIDPWLSSHANCPVCRASVAVTVNNNDTRPSGAASGSNGNNTNNRGLSRSRQDDFQQGLPDAANLV